MISSKFYSDFVAYDGLYDICVQVYGYNDSGNFIDMGSQKIGLKDVALLGRMGGLS